MKITEEMRKNGIKPSKCTTCAHSSAARGDCQHGESNDKKKCTGYEYARFS